MSRPIDDYALIGNTRTVALVSCAGSIDWLCLPRFDSPACFASLLGTEDNGRWLIAPSLPVRSIHRTYCGDTLVLETEFETASGRVKLIDFMPIARGRDQSDLIRMVQGVEGKVPMRLELVLRFEYGHILPWVRTRPDGLSAIAAPNAVRLASPVKLRGEDFRTKADFNVGKGDTFAFVMTWYPAHKTPPPQVDAARARRQTNEWWQVWSSRYRRIGPWSDAVMRSLITVKALTYEPTGGIAAAATTSLPESIGGARNWDYRYCWIRDATFTLFALLSSGYREDAKAWHEWLFRSVAGHPSQAQTLYGVAGERLSPEITIDWLCGYERSSPVRVGNDAYRQFQLDVFGEMMDSLHFAQQFGLDSGCDSREFQRAVIDYMVGAWRKPDNGIWEMRRDPRHYTHSKVMAWVAFDRAIRSAERFGVRGPLEKWRQIRASIHREVCARGFSARRNAFVQSYDSEDLDASLLMIPLVGFLPATDPRVAGTVDRIMRELTRDGLVMRYATREGTFIACSCWLADVLALAGRHDEAQELFKRVLSLRNDVGLLAEEFEPTSRRAVGNFPQVLSHVSLINCAHHLARMERTPERAGIRLRATISD